MGKSNHEKNNHPHTGADIDINEKVGLFKKKKKHTFSMTPGSPLPTFVLTPPAFCTTVVPTRRFAPGCVVFERSVKNTPTFTPFSVGSSSSYVSFNPAAPFTDTLKSTLHVSTSFKKQQLSNLNDIIETCRTLVAVNKAIATCVELDLLTAELEMYHIDPKK